MQSITWLEVRTMEEPRSYCSKVRMKSGLLLALGWTLMIAGWAWWPRGHLAGSLEVGHIQVGMDELDMAPHILEVGKAHGTSVGTLLQVDGRAFTYGYVDITWMWMLMGDEDADGKTSFLSLKESEIQTDNILHNRDSYC